MTKLAFTSLDRTTYFTHLTKLTSCLCSSHFCYKFATFTIKLVFFLANADLYVEYHLGVVYYVLNTKSTYLENLIS
jgi:hypothetical protein